MQFIDRRSASYGSDIMASSTTTTDKGPISPTVYLANSPLSFWYRDIWFSVLFILQLICTIGVAAVGHWVATSLSPAGSLLTPDPVRFLALLRWLSISTLGACSLAAFELLVFQMGGPAMLFTGVVEVVVCLGAYCGVHGQPLASAWAVALFVAIHHLLWLMVVRRHLSFSSSVLEMATVSLMQFPGLLVVTISVLALVTLYTSIWGLCVSVAFHFPLLARVIWVMTCLLLFQWTAEVFRNVVQLIVSGTVSLWYLGEGQTPPDATLTSFHRTTTTSFGSVCCGSTPLSLIIPLHAFLLSLQSALETVKSCNPLALVLNQLLHHMVPAMQHYNAYAYSHVAMYGKSYCLAARDTWTLTATCGLTRVFNDGLLNTALVLFSCLGGLMVGAAVAQVSASWLAFLLCAIEGTVVIGVVLTTCTSAATTICVCYAERPDLLQSLDPNLYSLINEAAMESAAAGLVPHHPMT